MLLLSLALSAVAEPLSHDEAVSDVWHLARLLEASHPDPFLRGGGRVAFYEAVDEAIRALPDGEVEVEELHAVLLPIVARVGDGHTSLAPVGAVAEADPLGLWLTALPDALVVSGVADPDDADLVGLRVDTVAGADVDTLLARQDRLAGSDNEQHRRSRLARRLTTGAGRAAVLDGPPTVELVALDGRRETWTPGPAAAGPPLPRDSRWAVPETGPHDLGWGFVDDGVAVLRITSMMRYREAFEVWRATGFEANLGAHLDAVAGASSRRLAKKQDARIAQVPSATETFQALFDAMEARDAHTLVVDLRGNQGGNSAISMVLGLFLVSDTRLAEAYLETGAYQLRRFSELFHVAHQNAERPAGVPDGGYDFRVLHEQPTLDESVERLRSYVAVMPTLEAALAEGPLHREALPTLEVLVDADTYSAGFDLVRLLDALGAELVGVPSSQSGNCFIDSVPFHLQHSRLRGSMSTKWSVAYPDDPERGRLLPMDRTLTWARWGALDFDPNAALGLALEAD